MSNSSVAKTVELIHGYMDKIQSLESQLKEANALCEKNYLQGKQESAIELMRLSSENTRLKAELEYLANGPRPRKIEDFRLRARQCLASLEKNGEGEREK